MSDKAERINWLRTIIDSYEEDEKTFGLVGEDLVKLAAWRKELAELEAA